MSMFCYQCQETAQGKGCTVRGVCGKSPEVAKIQDLLIYALKGLAQVMRCQAPSPSLERDELLLKGLFMTITNANFDEDALKIHLKAVLAERDALAPKAACAEASDAATFVYDEEARYAKAESIGILSEADEDKRSLKELVIYGLKGMAAYLHHAAMLQSHSRECNDFVAEALAACLDKDLDTDALTALVLKTGSFGVKAMALLDEANTGRFGQPELTEVPIGVRKNPGILVSGHDLNDLIQLLEQSQDSGVDIYTHSEMLPAHAYPVFKQYPHLAGNYGNAWWKQTTEFESFHGPILFTTNCIVPPRNEALKARIFTSGASGFPGCTHIAADAKGQKDFSALIALAKTLPPPEAIESGHLTNGLAHHQVLSLADKIIDAVKSGAIKHFFVMAGCDGRMKGRSYYTDFATALPQDSVILTAGCAKYRYNKLPLGDIAGIPRVIDAGQCNDSYSLVKIALALTEAFGLDSINDLPLSYNIAWYEQKAVIVLLALLSLGVKNIHLGPSLPGFLSPHVASVLVEQFGITGIGTVEEDLRLFLGA